MPMRTGRIGEGVSFASSLLEPHISGRLARYVGVKGVVVAINGQQVAADLFESPALFRRMWPKLLQSYLDAEYMFALPGAHRPCPAGAPAAFLKAAARDFPVDGGQTGAGPPGTPFGSGVHSWAIATGLPEIGTD
jgi:hypothetical protein